MVRLIPQKHTIDPLHIILRRPFVFTIFILFICRCPIVSWIEKFRFDLGFHVDYRNESVLDKGDNGRCICESFIDLVAEILILEDKSIVKRGNFDAWTSIF